MSVYKSQKASQGSFSGNIAISISQEIHKALYKEATSKNLSIAGLVRHIINNRSYINKRCIWKSDEYVKRSSYTAIFFNNNINEDEICIHLYGIHQNQEDINDLDHKFSNFIVHNLEFRHQVLLTCEIFIDESGEKQIKLLEFHNA